MKTSNLTFGEAVEHLKTGGLVAREGWNGKGMHLFLVFGKDVEPILHQYYELPVQDAIYMKTAQNTLVPWLASQADVLAEDWLIIV